MRAIPVLSNTVASSVRPAPTISDSCFELALVLFDLVRPELPSSTTSTEIPLAMGKTETSPPFASTIALVFRVDMNSAFAEADGARMEMAEPHSGQVDFCLFRDAGLEQGILAPIPIFGIVPDGCEETGREDDGVNGWLGESDCNSGDGSSGTEMSGCSSPSAFVFLPLPFPFFATGTSAVFLAALLALSSLTLTTFHPNSSFNHPHFVQHHPLLLPTGSSRSRRIRAV